MRVWAQTPVRELQKHVERNAVIMQKMGWKPSLRSRIVREGVKPKVDPLLSDLWHQYYEPYTLCTPTIDGEPCVAGCVASAMAQVMHYWQYPEHGYGSHTYVDSTGCKQILSCDFSQHAYNWANMLDDYEGVNYSPSEGLAVAQLMADCGVAVNMRYGTGASGARSVYQPQALYEHFGYDKGMQMRFRDFYTLDEFTLMLKRELSNGHPVLISAHSTSLGHAFVCDGYDERGFFHFSFGNPSGEGDAWIYLPYLTPDFPPAQDTSDPENGLNLLQSIQTGVVPANHPDAVGRECHEFAMSGITVLDDGRISTVRMGNVGWNKHDGEVRLALKRDGEIAALLPPYQHDFLLEEIDDTSYTDTLDFSIPANLSDGTYKLVPVFSQEDGWQEVRTSVGTPNYLIANVQGSTVEYATDSLNTAYLTLEDCSFPQQLSHHCTPDYTLTFRCHNAEMCGRFYVMLERLSDGWMPLIAEQGISIGKDEETVRHIHRTSHSLPEGEYIPRIFYENDLFSTDIIPLDLPHAHTIVVTPDAPSDIRVIEATPDRANATTYETNGVRISSRSVTPRIVISSDGRKVFE